MRNLPIYLHSYSLRDYSLEETLQFAADCGFDGLELHTCHFDAAEPKDEIRRCKPLCQRAGVPIGCVDFKADLLQRDPKQRETEVVRLERLVAVCAENGIGLMNGFTGFLVADPNDFGANGSTIADSDHYEGVASGLRRVAAAAERARVTLTLEIHMNTIHDTVAATGRLLDMVGSPAILANPDPGNTFATRTAEHGAAALQELGGRIGYFHFKNCAFRDGMYDFSVGLEAGQIDIVAYVRQIAALGYNGPVCIEYVGEGDPRPILGDDLVYLKNCFDQVAAHTFGRSQRS